MFLIKTIVRLLVGLFSNRRSRFYTSNNLSRSIHITVSSKDAQNLHVTYSRMSGKHILKINVAVMNMATGRTANYGNSVIGQQGSGIATSYAGIHTSVSADKFNYLDSNARRIYLQKQARPTIRPTSS